jgi:hypothetical protein
MTKTTKPRDPARPAGNAGPTKMARIIAMLQRPQGASVAELAKMTGWQIKTVRGVMAGVLKTRFGLTIVSEKPADVRIYRAKAQAPS